ncbi:MAG: VanW family protein [Actinobacteria bacterium]|nr:VanW family protein [Actinomycetota bacterium]
MLRFRRLTALFVIIVLQTTLAISAGGSVFKEPSGGIILPGVSAAGINLGGMAPETAGEILRAKVGALGKDSITLVSGDRQWKIPLERVGAVCDYREAVEEAFAVGHSGPFARRLSELLGSKAQSTVIPLRMEFNREALKRELEKINTEYSIKPGDAKLVLEDERIKIVPTAYGNEMDIEGTMSRILALQADSFDINSLSSKTTAPPVKDEDIADLTDIIGECTTRFETGSAGRAGNIARASEQIDGRLIRPGEVFTYNAVISPVNGTNGYHKAPVIVGDQLIDDYGGGVCQVSTTLYGAVLLAGLEIVERHPHSKPVKYVSPGLDATVVEGVIDFKVRNNLASPVYIISSAVKDRGYVKVIIAGKKEGSSFYRIEPQVKTISPGIVIKSNPRLKRGQSMVIDPGSPGFEALVYRVSVNGDNEERELISKDYYQPEPKIVEVGVTQGRR